MTLAERLRQIASALPSDSSAVMFTRADLLALLSDDIGQSMAGPATRDLTVEEVAQATGRAPSTVRGWLITGTLRGYKINGRDWRVPRSALRDSLESQRPEASGSAQDLDEVDITAWRRVGGA